MQVLARFLWAVQHLPIDCHTFANGADCQHQFGRRAMIRLRQLMFIPLLLSPAFAETEAPLQGTAFLGESGCPDGLKSKDCVVSFQLTGKAAKLLFDGMRVKAVKEECTGGMEKSDGNGLHCIKSADGRVDCDFGYDFNKKHFAGSAVDC
jgi:hypothetical protein